jgi:CRP-like cAMP-binding protein
MIPVMSGVDLMSLGLVTRDRAVSRHRLGPGEFFGEMAVLTGEPRSATVTASRDTTLVAIGREAFGELFEKAPEAARAATARDLQTSPRAVTGG